MRFTLFPGRGNEGEGKRRKGKEIGEKRKKEKEMMEITVCFKGKQVLGSLGSSPIAKRFAQFCDFLGKIFEITKILFVKRKRRYYANYNNSNKIFVKYNK